MVAQLVKDLLHLEGGEDRLDEHRGANRAAGNQQVVLCEVEDVIPQPCLEMAFQLGQIEVRAAALAQKALRVVKKVKAEVEQAARNRRAVQLHVPLVEG